jgi:hypothetical protein
MRKERRAGESRGREWRKGMVTERRVEASSKSLHQPLLNVEVGLEALMALRH